MEQILEIINAISTTEFLPKYQFINENRNRNDGMYKKTLGEWYLVSELWLINNDISLKQSIGNDRKLNRLYNKTAFDSKGNYNMDRYVELKKHITDKVRLCEARTTI